MNTTRAYKCAFFAIVLILAASQTVAAEPCSFSTLKRIHENVNTLSTDEIESFLGTLDNSCMGNVEFSEWSNELTFLVVTNKPGLFFEVLDRQSEEKLAIVTGILESPIHDGIDLQKAYTAAKSTKTTSKTKPRVLESLQVAAGKYDGTLK